MTPSGRSDSRDRWRVGGVDCLAIRHPTLGHWCGYVGVPAGHLAYGVAYDDVEVRVHGGLTFAGTWDDEEGDLWWLGFDCAHYGDTPDVQDLAYVQKEAEDLAAQLGAPLRIRRWRIEQ